MKLKRFTSVLLLSFAIGALTAANPPQGKGKGKDKAQEEGKGQGQGSEKKVGKADSRGGGQSQSVSAKVKANQRVSKSGKGGGGSASVGAIVGRGSEASERGRENARFRRDLSVTELRPGVRRFFDSNKNSERLAAGAVAHAYARGIKERDFVIAPNTDRVLVKNRKGEVLVDLDDDRARKLGKWKVNVLDDRVTGGAPSFCRSGAGHPVWGRQWCVEKGFGIGTDRNFRWARTNSIDQAIILRPTNTASAITRDVLAGILGNVVTDRLALHAITLGLVDPLVGRWLGEPNGQRVLLVSSGNTPVAEFTDTNRDNQADVLLVALKPWE